MVKVTSRLSGACHLNPRGGNGGRRRVRRGRRKEWQLGGGGQPGGRDEQACMKQERHESVREEMTLVPSVLGQIMDKVSNV